MRHRNRAVAAFAIVMCLSLPSCITSALWEQDDGESWSVEDVVGRLAATPFTLLLDMLTLSLQERFGADGERDRYDDSDRARRQACRR